MGEESGGGVVGIDERGVEGKGVVGVDGEGRW